MTHDLAFGSRKGKSSGHVHEARLDDDELGRLRTFALLSGSSVDEAFRRIETRAFRATKSSKVEWMNGNNKAVKKCLDLYFGEMSRVVLASGTVRFPKTYSDKS